jgi:RNA polymerase sigma-70 factor (ECF subfamily)
LVLYHPAVASIFVVGNNAAPRETPVLSECSSAITEMTAKEYNENPVLEGANGKRRRYQELVKNFYHDIFRYAYWLCKSRPLAEDLTQETFMRAWRAFDSLQSEAAAKAWLFTILRRENARLYEKFQPELDDIDEYESGLPDTHRVEPDQQMEMHLLYKAMQKLETEYREPLVLQVIGGFSGEEIATMLDLNNNTVMTRLFRARNKLRALLDTDDIPEGR